MLGEHPIDVMLLATDLGVAREFYGDTIGLEILLESDDFLTFKCGGDSRLVVTRSATGSSEPQTKASWRVKDLAAEVTELRSRGVELEQYDEPGLKTVDGDRRRRLCARRLAGRPARKLDRAAAVQSRDELTGGAEPRRRPTERTVPSPRP